MISPTNSFWQAFYILSYMSKLEIMPRMLFTIGIFVAILQVTHAQNNFEVIKIPMRDGKTLAADLYLPNTDDSFPVILIQTPYNKNFYRTRGLPLGINQQLNTSAYAFVILDWRCRFASLDACNPQATGGEDGYDAVEWIAAQPWCTGKIGTLGPSALGNIQFQTAREQPPHLICAVPEVASPQTHYQQYFKGGIIQSGYFKTLSLLFPGAFGLVVANPHYNFLWTIAENETMYPESIQIPILLVAGWFDHNTLDDLLLIDTLARSSDPSVRNQHKILIGPWVHGGTGQAYVGTSVQGDLEFPEAAQWNERLAKDFFDHYLRDMNNGWENHARYIYFQMGMNSWSESDTWPAVSPTPKDFFLTETGDMTLEPVPEEASLIFTYDPEDPSPTVGGKTLSIGLIQGPVDQAPVENRGDNLIFTSPVLESEMSIQGKVKAHLFVSSNVPDTDIALRLTDVYPDGRSILLNESILRLRFRDGFRIVDTTFLETGIVYPIVLSFEDLAHTFLRDHQIRLIVTSSNYPHYNRNMNTGEEMYPNQNIDTLVNPQIAENSIWMSTTYPSRLEMPVVEFTTAVSKKIDNRGLVAIYPNPASQFIYFQGIDSGCWIDVFNIYGEKIVDNKEINDGKLNIHQLPIGTYLAMIRNKHGGHRMGRFMVVR